MSPLRRPTHRKNKSNWIDAETLPRTLLVDPERTKELHLLAGPPARLHFLVRRRDTLVDSIRRRTQRIQSLLEPLVPGLFLALGSLAFAEPGRALLRTSADPRTVVRLGHARPLAFLQGHYRLALTPALARAILRAPGDAGEPYRPVREVGLEKHITALYQGLDPQGVLPSLPGISTLLAAGIRSVIGDIDRFPSLAHHCDSAGLCPRYKRYLYLAAENARQ